SPLPKSTKNGKDYLNQITSPSLDFKKKVVSTYSGIDITLYYHPIFCAIQALLQRPEDDGSETKVFDLKLLSKVGQLKVMTASDYCHIMKIAIFALDEIFSEENEITCKELCELYTKFNKMYTMSRQESYTENELNIFE
ncbi:9348_t:CDS:2, partial [Rhizophagus irregularis]